MNLTEPRSVHDHEIDDLRFCTQCDGVVDGTLFVQRDEASFVCGEGHPTEVDIEELL